ncbi:dcm methylase [Enterobacter bugandensis]|nr:dcm methylase [Enterobacter bugandensis]MCK7435926.1 dcm methylase [Enterobacter bugandensis]
MTDKGFIICLCDESGVMAEPWLEAGYNAILVDPKHKNTYSSTPHKGGGVVWKIGREINHPATFYYLRIAMDYGVDFVAGFPPCTDVAVSGSARFEEKRAKDIHFQAKAALIAEQCRIIGQLSGAPWFFENPVSVFSSIFGKPQHIFNPCEYGGYIPEEDAHPIYPGIIPPRDGYMKKTCLWTGNGFVMPPKLPVPGLPFHEAFALGGKSERTKQIRSTTPRGFARAVFLYNQDAANDGNFTPAQIPRAG